MNGSYFFLGVIVYSLENFLKQSEIRNYRYESERAFQSKELMLIVDETELPPKYVQEWKYEGHKNLPWIRFLKCINK